jgi:hypothetical protein
VTATQDHLDEASAGARELLADAGEQAALLMAAAESQREEILTDVTATHDEQQQASTATLDRAPGTAMPPAKGWPASGRGRRRSFGHG